MPRKSRGGNFSRKSKKSIYIKNKRAVATEEEREAYLLAERLRSKERRARKREADNKVDNNLSCPSSDIPQTSGSSPQNTLTVQSNHSHEPDPSSQPLPSQPQPVAHRVPSTQNCSKF